MRAYAATSCVADTFCTSALVRYLLSPVIYVPHLEHSQMALPLSSFSGVADQVCGGHCCVMMRVLPRLVSRFFFGSLPLSRRVPVPSRCTPRTWCSVGFTRPTAPQC